MRFLTGLLALALAGAVSACALGTDPARDVGVRIADFGDNPGRLRMYKYVPQDLPPAPAMVVVLHHCFQYAADYVEEAGWVSLADRYGFVLLMPEEVPLNDLNLCFDSYSGSDARGRGEAESIREMIERMVVDHKVDRQRIFVTGLSSGGSMALMMLAAYPEIFAGGGAVGSVTFGCTSIVFGMVPCLAVGEDKEPQEWGDIVRAASPHQGPWPIVSVWHGDADIVTNPDNAEETVEQWTNVHGTDAVPDLIEQVEGYPRYVYEDSAGRAVVEYYSITGMGHSVPIDLKRGCGDSRDGVGDFVSDMHICSSLYMAKFWGLVADPGAAAVSSTK